MTDIALTADALTTMDYRMAAEAITETLERSMTQDRRAAMVVAERRLAHAEELFRRAAMKPVLTIEPHVLNEAYVTLKQAVEHVDDQNIQAEALLAMRRALEAVGCIVLPPWHKK